MTRKHVIIAVAGVILFAGTAQLAAGGGITQNLGQWQEPVLYRGTIPGGAV